MLRMGKCFFKAFLKPTFPTLSTTRLKLGRDFSAKIVSLRVIAKKLSLVVDLDVPPLAGFPPKRGQAICREKTY